MVWDLKYIFVFSFLKKTSLEKLWSFFYIVYLNLQDRIIKTIHFHSGLDPAGPVITYGVIIPISEPLERRLDKSDAKYVQCIHTSYTTFGTLVDCGYADFYMNKGRNQPACNGDFYTCNHGMAHEYFSESMLGHIFVGPHCSEGSIEYFAKHNILFRPLLEIVDAFLRNNCNHSQTDYIGVDSKKLRGRFFVETNAAYPYAKKSYEAYAMSTMIPFIRLDAIISFKEASKSMKLMKNWY